MLKNASDLGLIIFDRKGMDRPIFKDKCLAHCRIYYTLPGRLYSLDVESAMLAGSPCGSYAICFS